ncbi:Oplophorus-luciferin 2-monooxygenase non-catalytic subunit [Portunus trituberculatus]|uniref:Oplophorus-luciferin 2-monooxygenase non-catalytic subunit n=1 Tax=Portunus trituberculatus TaxID=210409 RepID=A0A5B7F202_PORTR|nr:Oplophorus-luciferin 2-monooxygenase non-catalytic subunit [Portunus trituberculatus]
MPEARQSLAGSGPPRDTLSKMALCYVPAVLAIAAVGLASRVPHPAELTGITPGWPCPIQTQIAPCICSMDTGYNLLMDCSLARSEEQLEKIFSSIFPFKDFYELKIEHNPDDTDNVIDKITANTFADISFERIIITGTRLQDIIDEAFADSHKTLRHLDLSFNTLHTFPFESLALYEQLHTFIIDNNQFPDLFDLESLSLEIFSASRNHNMKMNSPHPFRGAPSLRELYLSEIGLTTLRTRLFNNLTKLEVVDFSNNHLTRLEQETINVTVNTLRHVSFDDNDIFNISNGALIAIITTIPAIRAIVPPPTPPLRHTTNPVTTAATSTTAILPSMFTMCWVVEGTCRAGWGGMQGRHGSEDRGEGGTSRCLRKVAGENLLRCPA